MIDVISAFFDFHWVRYVLLAVYVMSVVGITVVIISENRNPVKSLAWVTVLFLLPAVGLILYLFFGRNIRNTRKISLRFRRRLSRCKAPHTSDYTSLGLSSESLQQITLGANLTDAQLYIVNAAEVFTNGTDKFARLQEDIRAARHYINIQYYIIEDDTIGNIIGDLLIERAKAGVTVRVIYDHVGSFNVRNKLFKRLAAAGVQIHPFFEVTFPQFGTRINWRNHRKICVIDGRVGYIGGMNIADRYISGGKFALWRDTHLRVEGPVVASLQYSFAVDWHFMGKEPIAEVAECQPVANPTMYGQLVTSGPSSKWPNIAFMLHQAIGAASRRIYIQTPYFLPTDSLLKALITAALARVDVRVMLPARSDSHLLDFASASYISQCLGAGVKFYFYRPGMLHTKCIIIDDELTTVGSTNFDFRSFEHNFEANLFIYSKQFNEQILSVFRADMAESERVFAAQWRKRPIVRRAVESVVRLLAPIL